MFRGYYSFLIELGSTPSLWRTEFKNTVLNAGWRVLNEDTINNVLDIYPSLEESVGNEDYFEFLRVTFTDASTEFKPCLFAKDTAKEYGEVVRARFTTTSTTVTKTMVINGELIEVLFSEAPTIEEQRDLFVQRINDNPNLVGVVDRAYAGTTGESFYIHATPGNNLNIGATSFTGATVVGESFSNNQVVHYSTFSNGYSVTADYNVGFIYYLSVYDRTITLATKTVEGFYGPISASYSENEKSLLMTPEGCPPVELVITDASSVDNLVKNSRASVSHHNGKTVADTQSVNNGVKTPPSSNPLDITEDMFTRRVEAWADYPDMYQDTALGTYPTISSWTVSGLGHDLKYLNATNSWYYPDYVTGIQPVVLSAPPQLVHRSNVTVYIYGVRHELPEVFFLTDAVIDESLSVARDMTLVGELASSITPSTTEIELVDASAFPEAGTIFVGDEIIAYAAKTENVLNECRRGRLGTISSDHAQGEAVQAGSWFVKINNGAIFVGHERPT